MIFEKVRDIIVRELKVDPEKITMDTDFAEDLAADSLDAVEILMAVEEEFGVEVNDDDAQNIHSVGDIVRYLENQK